MAADAFKTARDFLLAHRTDHATAYRDFRWPNPTHFNWALDWFDNELARGDNANRAALTIVGEGAAHRSASPNCPNVSIASPTGCVLWQRQPRRSRDVLMLGNVLPLWEVMLAAMETRCRDHSGNDVADSDRFSPDRFTRGRARHVITTSTDTGKFTEFKQHLSLIAVGSDAMHPAGIGYDDLLMAPAAFTPDGATSADDPLLLYFTSGTTAEPKLVLHSHRSYPIGSLSTMFLLGQLQSGDVHLNIFVPWFGRSTPGAAFSPPGTLAQRCSSPINRGSTPATCWIKSPPTA